MNDSHGSCDEDGDGEAAEREALTKPEVAPPLATSERTSSPPPAHPAGQTGTNGHDHLSPKPTVSPLYRLIGGCGVRVGCVWCQLPGDIMAIVTGWCGAGPVERSMSEDILSRYVGLATVAVTYGSRN